MAYKDYLPTVQADYIDEYFTIRGKKSIEFSFDKPISSFTPDGGIEEITDLADYYDVLIDSSYDNLNQLNKDFILDLYADSYKANGLKNSFVFKHPATDDYYICKFINNISESLARNLRHSYGKITFLSLGTDRNLISTSSWIIDGTSATGYTSISSEPVSSNFIMTTVIAAPDVSTIGAFLFLEEASIDIDWGDETIDNYYNIQPEEQFDPSYHIYYESGTYTITISGDLDKIIGLRIYNSDAPRTTNVLNIESFGDVKNLMALVIEDVTKCTGTSSTNRYLVSKGSVSCEELSIQNNLLVLQVFGDGLRGNSSDLPDSLKILTLNNPTELIGDTLPLNISYLDIEYSNDIELSMEYLASFDFSISQEEIEILGGDARRIGITNAFDYCDYSYPVTEISGDIGLLLSKNLELNINISGGDLSYSSTTIDPAFGQQAIHIQSNGLSESEVDAILADYDASMASGCTGVLSLTGNESPSSASDSHIASLRSKGLIVFVS